VLRLIFGTARGEVTAGWIILHSALPQILLRYCVKQIDSDGSSRVYKIQSNQIWRHCQLAPVKDREHGVPVKEPSDLSPQLMYRHKVQRVKLNLYQGVTVYQAYVHTFVLNCDAKGQFWQLLCSLEGDNDKVLKK
jgi:hypothetical protein